MQKRAPRLIGLTAQILFLMLLVTISVAFAQYFLARLAVQDLLSNEHQKASGQIAHLLNNGYLQWEQANEQLAGVVAANPIFSSYSEISDTTAISTFLEQQGTVMSFDDGVSSIYAYGENGRPLGGWGMRPPAELTPHIASVILTNKPSHLISCISDHCWHYTVVPLYLYRESQKGALVTSADFVTFLQMQHVLTGSDLRLHYGASHLPLTKDVDTITLSASQIPLPKNYHLLAVFRTSYSDSAIKRFWQSTIVVTFLAYSTMAVLLFFSLSLPLRRLRRMSSVFPLLVSGQFELFRQRLRNTRFTHFYDEIDVLADISVKLSRDLQDFESARINLKTAEKLSVVTAKVLEQEKKRIAKDLHDELGQHLAALLLETRSIRPLADNPDHVLKKIDYFEKSLHHIYDRVNVLMDKIRPEILDTLGLEDSLYSLIHEFGQISEECKYILTIENSLSTEIDDETSTAIYRIVKECLTNTAKHSKATQVYVNIDSDDDVLELEISDNGIGFDIQQIDASQSIAVMRQRIESLGGILTIKSIEMAGTTICVRLPIYPTIITPQRTSAY